jgi:hypothetical protein
MALFLGVHKIPSGATDEDVMGNYEKYKNGAQEKGIIAVSAVYNLEKGFAYCQTEAESAQQVIDAHTAANVPVEEIIEIKPLQ